MYGCEGMGDGYASYVEATPRDVRGVCDHEPSPTIAVVYFGLYIFIAGFLMLNLFIGVILVTRTHLHVCVDATS